MPRAALASRSVPATVFADLQRTADREALTVIGDVDTSWDAGALETLGGFVQAGNRRDAAGAASGLGVWEDDRAHAKDEKGSAAGSAAGSWSSRGRGGWRMSRQWCRVIARARASRGRVGDCVCRAAGEGHLEEGWSERVPATQVRGAPARGAAGGRSCLEQPLCELVDVRRAGCDPWRRAQHAPARRSVRGRLLAAWCVSRRFALGTALTVPRSQTGLGPWRKARSCLSRLRRSSIILILGWCPPRLSVMSWHVLHI
jgi:hypothetical protein